MFVTRTALVPESLREAWVALAGLSAVFLFEMLDNSILNVALPTIGRDLHASTTALQWVTSAYAVVFGGLMLVFCAIADRFGRRRIMFIGLALLGVASLATAFVTTADQLIAVRVAMRVAAAMTTPGSMALAFRLFQEDSLRVRVITLISTVGLVGLAIGPTVGGFVLAVAPWQVLLLVNVPIAALAIAGIRIGIAADETADLHRDPVDVLGAALGTATIALALVAPTLFVDEGASSWAPWGGVISEVVLPDRDDVHHREDAGPTVVITLDLFVVDPEAPDPRVAGKDLFGHIDGDQGIDLAREQHRAEGLIIFGVTHLNVFRHRLRHPAERRNREVGATDDPLALIRRDPEFVGGDALDGSPWFRVSGDVVLAGHAASRAVA